MNIKTSIVLLLLVNVLLYSQKIELSSITKINSEKMGESFYPKFSNDDNQIIFTSSNYKGLYSYNLITEKTGIISEKNGVGYNPIILSNDKVLNRSFDFVDGKKMHSVLISEINSGEIETLELSKRNVSIPQQIVGSEIVLVENFGISLKQISEKTLLKSAQNTTAVYSENNSLFLVKDKQVVEISPLGKGVYVWESFSNDGNKIIFTFGNKGAFICDLEGNILSNIKDAHYAKFSPDGKYILYMKDEDDGYKYIASELFVYSLEENSEYQLTSTNDKIEMYAEWSNDGKSVVYNTADGDIYMAKINIEN